MNVYVGNNSSVKGYDLILVPGKNLYTGSNSFLSEFREITSLENDLLNVASGIYATDLAVKRSPLEEYIRTIYLSLDVVNVHAFERIKSLLEKALYNLSCDNWSISFNGIVGEQESRCDFTNKDGAVLLFSGGLDSLCGATYYLEKNIHLNLVSHVTRNIVTINSQRTIYAALKEGYDESLLHRSEFRVGGRKLQGYVFPEEREDSQRLRSFLFLSLAALVARRSGISKIISIAENGQFAIHLPLSAARVGPFSTHTADPKFVLIAQELFQILLGLNDLVIENPFLYLSKAEVVSFLPDKLRNLIESSVSCWKASRVATKNHCGECIPCFARRIALETNGLILDEFEVDLFNSAAADLPPEHEGKRNLVDYLGFVKLFKDTYERNKSDLLFEFPELINEAIDFDRTIDMYYKIAQQSFTIFQNYPGIKSLLS